MMLPLTGDKHSVCSMPLAKSEKESRKNARETEKKEEERGKSPVQQVRLDYG